MAHAAEFLALAYLLSQVVRLHAIGRDDAHVYPFLKETIYSHLVYVSLQVEQQQVGLGFVYPAVVLADILFWFFVVNPHYRSFIVKH